MRVWGMLATAVATVAIAVLLSACAGTKTVTERAAEREAPTTSAAVAPTNPHKAPARVVPNNPAQRPNHSATISCAKAIMGHACVASTTTPSDPNEFPQRNCDTNIVANSGTSCGLAENAFYEYYKTGESFGHAVTVHSPTTGKDYELFCEREPNLIGCTGTPVSTDIYVSFPIKAVEAYTSAQAAAYARTRDVGHPAPPARETSPPHESESEPYSVPENQEEREPEVPAEPEEESPGEHSNDGSFCSTHECIGEYEKEPGTVVECSDGTYSHAGGIQGACSHHGGER